MSFQLPKKVKYPNFIALQREEQQCTLAEKDTEVYKIETNIAVPSIPNKKTKIQENQGTLFFYPSWLVLKAILLFLFFVFWELLKQGPLSHHCANIVSYNYSSFVYHELNLYISKNHTIIFSHNYTCAVNIIQFGTQENLRIQQLVQWNLQQPSRGVPRRRMKLRKILSHRKEGFLL